MNLEKKFEKSLMKKWCMRFKTSHPDRDNYDGVVICNKPDFIVFLDEENFEFDGIICMPKRFIKSIRDGKYEKCCNEILRQNGQTEKISTPEWLNSCENFKQIIAYLKSRDIWAAFENLSNSSSSFYIGPITKIGKKNFRLYCYDAAGKWESEYTLPIKEIFKIEFDSNYCNYFNRFMKSKDETLPG